MIQCPYCLKYEDDPDDCYETSTTYFTECIHCKKEYSFSIEYTPHYSVSKIPCNDGKPHKYRFLYTFKYTDFYKCLYCEKERKLHRNDLK